MMGTMLTRHFALSEFTDSQTAARKGIDNTPTPEVLAKLTRTATWLEDVRTILGAPILISSGYRSPALNKAVGGSRTSQHMTGQAVDFTAPRFGSPRAVIDKIMGAGLSFDQLILEFPPDGWVHASVSDNPRGQALVIDRSGTKPFLG